MGRGSRKRKRVMGKKLDSVIYIAPLLALALIVMIGCVTERFCVNQLSMENRKLTIRLRELSEEISRMERDVGLLAARDRIEKIATEDLDLRLSCRNDQILLPDWQTKETRAGTGESLVASLFLSAGRGIEQIMFARGRNEAE